MIDEAYVVLAISHERGKAISVIAGLPFATKRAAEEAKRLLNENSGVEAYVIDDHDDGSPSAFTEAAPLTTE